MSYNLSEFQALCTDRHGKCGPLSNWGKTLSIYLFVWASDQDKLERKSVWACKSDSEGGAKKRVVLKLLKITSTVKSYLTQPQFLTKGTHCQFCSSGRKQGIVNISLFKSVYAFFIHWTA